MRSRFTWGASRTRREVRGPASATRGIACPVRTTNGPVKLKEDSRMKTTSLVATTGAECARLRTENARLFTALGQQGGVLASQAAGWRAAAAERDRVASVAEQEQGEHLDEVLSLQVSIGRLREARKAALAEADAAKLAL